MCTSQNVSVWGFAWLNNDTIFGIQTAPTPGMEEMKVAKLIDEDTHAWDRELISMLFDLDDVMNILKTPLMPKGAEDMVI